jgi:predicted transposase/invertase (TIGR01784 family)
MAEKYINPFTDFGFKKLFGEEATKDLLLDFLNAVLHDEEGLITSLEFSNNEHLGKMEIDRKVVFDIYCTNERGEKFIVEVQKARQIHYKDRSLFYATFPIQEQATTGNWDFKLKAVYSISILDFLLDEKDNAEKYFHKIKLVDTETYQIFSDKLTFVYLEMPKFKKDQEELLNKFEKWLFLLKHLPRLENLPVKMQEKIFKKVMNVAELAKLNREERAAYEHSLKNYRDLQNVKDTYFQEGKEEGKLEGKLEGILEGEKKGKVEGKIETAINARKQGLPMDVIVAITQLSEEELRKIFEEKGI